MKEPPSEDHGGNDHQAECLVSLGCAPLLSPTQFFGDMLLVRLDAAFDHVWPRNNLTVPLRFHFRWPVGSANALYAPKAQSAARAVRLTYPTSISDHNLSRFGRSEAVRAFP
jgi:hypothetical protein